MYLARLDILVTYSLQVQLMWWTKHFCTNSNYTEQKHRYKHMAKPILNLLINWPVFLFGNETEICNLSWHNYMLISNENNSKDIWINILWLDRIQSRSILWAMKIKHCMFLTIKCTHNIILINASVPVHIIAQHLANICKRHWI